MTRTRFFRRAFCTAVQSVRRNKGGFVAAAASIAVALTMTGIALLLQTQVALAKGEWYDKAGITAYLCTASSATNGCNGTPDPGRVDALAAELRELPGVAEVYVETPGAAWQEFSRRFAGTEILRSVSPEAIPGSLRIQAENGTTHAEVISRIGTRDDIEKMVDQRELLRGFFRAVGGLQIAAGVFAATQAAATVTLVGNLVRTALRQRRNEVRIMDLVGAPNRMVRAPFVIESVAVCAIGALCAVGLLTVGVSRLLPRIAGGTSFRLVNTGDVANTGIWLLAAAVLLGWTVSRVALRHGAREDHD
jgi:cell division transport system permease protein